MDIRGANRESLRLSCGDCATVAPQYVQSFILDDYKISRSYVCRVNTLPILSKDDGRHRNVRQNWACKAPSDELKFENIFINCSAKSAKQHRIEGLPYENEVAVVHISHIVHYAHSTSEGTT